MSFARPEALWLCLLAPLAAAASAWLWRRRLVALRSWATPGLWRRLGIDLGFGRLALTVSCLTAAVLATSLALARPRWGTVEQRLDLRGVDVVFVLDSSLSMLTRDVTPSRMEIAKALIRRLVESLPGHRFGLVQAEGEGIALAPLTIDSAVIDLLMDTVTPASLPQPGTRLASALEAARQLFPEAGDRHRVMVIVSDGEDHGSRWRDQLPRLADERIVVHSLGVGSRRGAPIALSESETPRYKEDKDGKVVMSKLRPEVLETLAESTGGLFVEVGSPAVGPAPIADAIDSLQKTSIDGTVLDVQAERFQWPLAVASGALCLLLAMPAGRADGARRRSR